MKKDVLEQEIKEFIYKIKDFEDFEGNENISEIISKKYGKLKKYILELGQNVVMYNQITGTSTNIYDAIHNGPLLGGKDRFKEAIKDLNHILGKLEGMTDKEFQHLFSPPKEKVIEKEVEVIVEKKGFFYYSNPLYWVYSACTLIYNFSKKHKTLSILMFIIAVLTLIVTAIPDEKKLEIFNKIFL